MRAYIGPHHDHQVDNHVDMLYASVYHGATESMAAIGMVAPMIESTLFQAFASLGQMYRIKNMQPLAHKRWKRANAHVDRWNVQVYYSKNGEAKRDILSGFSQLSAASGFKKFLPLEFSSWFCAVFNYRNFMFHNGFEWPLGRRKAFKEMVEKHKWEKYFNSSTLGGEPWIFYITDEEISKMPIMIGMMLDSLGSFSEALPFDLISDS